MDDEDCKCRCLCTFIFVVISIGLCLAGLMYSWIYYNINDGLFLNLKLTDSEELCSDDFTNEVYRQYYSSNRTYLSNVSIVGGLYIVLFIIYVIYLSLQSVEEENNKNN